VSQLPAKATTATLTGTKSGTTDVPDDVGELVRLLFDMSHEERLALIEAARASKRTSRRRHS
jgi:hypothetical protein